MINPIESWIRHYTSTLVQPLNFVYRKDLEGDPGRPLGTRTEQYSRPGQSNLHIQMVHCLGGTDNELVVFDVRDPDVDGELDPAPSTVESIYRYLDNGWGLRSAYLRAESERLLQESESIRVVDEPMTDDPSKTVQTHSTESVESSSSESAEGSKQTLSMGR